MIPESFIRDLLCRSDLISIVSQYLALHKSGSNFISICPFHNEKKPSFTINPSRQFYHCFGCMAHGNAISFLMKYLGLSFQEAIRSLANSVGMDFPKDGNYKTNGEKSTEPNVTLKKRLHHEILERALAYYVHQLRNSSLAINYLKDRGITGNIAKRFSIGWSSFKFDGLKEIFENYNDPTLVQVGLISESNSHKRFDCFRGRIMFPIRSINKGELIAFGGRAIGSIEPKYINTSETFLFSKSRELYGLWESYFEIRKKGTVIIVEGYMDVIGLAQQGINNAVAVLGTAVTSEHISKLFQISSNLLFCFDGDEAGKKAAWRALKICLPMLKNHQISIRFLFLPEGYDPDSYARTIGQDSFQEFIKNSVSLSKFFLDELSSHHNTNEAEGRANFLLETRDLLSLIPECIFRGELERELSAFLRLTTDELRIMLHRGQNQKLSSFIKRDSLNPNPRFNPIRKIQNAVIKASKALPSVADRLVNLFLLYPDLIKSIQDEEYQILEQNFSLQVVRDLILLAKTSGARGFKDTMEVVKMGSDLQILIADLEKNIDSWKGLPYPEKELAGLFRQIQFSEIQKEMSDLINSGLKLNKDRKRYQDLSKKIKVMKMAK